MPRNAKITPARTPRKKAPNLDIVADYYKDEMKEKKDWAKKKLAEQGVTDIHFCWRKGDEGQDEKERLGYSNAIIDGKQPVYRELVLCYCSKEQQYRDREAPAQVAIQQLEDAEAGEGANYSATDKDGETHGLVAME